MRIMAIDYGDARTGVAVSDALGMLAGETLVEASGDDEPIVEGGEGALYDPWGTEYKYEKKGKRFVVISAGPDGEFGGDDDIRSDVTKRSTGND